MLSGCVQPLFSQDGHFSLVLFLKSEADDFWVPSPSLWKSWVWYRNSILVLMVLPGRTVGGHREASCQQGKPQIPKERHRMDHGLFLLKKLFFFVYKIQCHFKTTRMKISRVSEDGNPSSHALSPSVQCFQVRKVRYSSFTNSLSIPPLESKNERRGLSHNRLSFWEEILEMDFLAGWKTVRVAS